MGMAYIKKCHKSTKECRIGILDLIIFTFGDMGNLGTSREEEKLFTVHFMKYRKSAKSKFGSPNLSVGTD
jgi:hypothetical protein